MNKKISASLFTIIILLLSGCAINNGDRTRIQSYSNDGYMGLSSANPNLVTSPGYHTYSKDYRLMQDTLKRIPGIRRYWMNIEGGQVNVRLVLKEGLTSGEISGIYDRAYKDLSLMMPRYRINLIQPAK
ncbi:hypothetical protein [Ferviditalea candida]|uniref:Lipoprotein n=1 Tax=Ferviditalea candida TaxID=3108399 RepID=A0ABU5ZIZ8_9BACL|nr:hypothetical protein [Paenibacillaceae bacterium T2]